MLLTTYRLYTLLALPKASLFAFTQVQGDDIEEQLREAQITIARLRKQRATLRVELADATSSLEGRKAKLATVKNDVETTKQNFIQPDKLNAVTDQRNSFAAVLARTRGAACEITVEDATLFTDYYNASTGISNA